MTVAQFTSTALMRHWQDFESAGGTQTELAKRAGVRQGAISTWLTKLKAKEVPKLDAIEALARGFGVPVYSLFPEGELRAPVRRALSILSTLEDDQAAMLVEGLAAAATRFAVPQDSKKSRKDPGDPGRG